MQKRVLASATALAGFLLVAALQLALVVVPVLLLLSMLPGAAALRLGLPVCIATVGVMAYATWRALHTRRPEPVGIPVARADAPQLWALLDGAAAAAGTRAPDRVTIVADAAAKIIERTHLLGLLGGRRDLYLGLPLLQAWDEAHLRAVTAHELGHFSPRLGRLAPLAYRGRVAIGRTVPRIPARNPAGPLLRTYAKFYRRVDAPFSRAQELIADQIAAEYAGRTAAAAVLRDLPALEALQRIFHAEYLGPGWQAGHVPDDLFGGFLRVLAARADDVAVLRARDPGTPTAWDTHPPVAARLAALTPAPAATPAVPAPEKSELVGAAVAASADAPAATGRPTSADAPASAPGDPMPFAGALAATATDTPASATGDPMPLAGALAATATDAPSSAQGDPMPFAGASAATGRPTAAAASPSAPGDPMPFADASAATGRPTAADAPASAAGEASRDDDFGAPAGELVPDLPGLGRALQGVAFPAQGRTTVDWDAFFGAARTVEMQREADAALATISRAAGVPVTNAADVLDLAADGRLHKAAESVFAGLPADETAGRVAELVTLLLALAALRSGAARWRHSWTGNAELIAADGAHLDLGGLAALASDPATVVTARERLAGLGIDAAAGPGAETAQTRPEVVGGVVNLVVDGARTDLLIVDTGLFLVPGLPRSQNGSAKRRLARFAAADVPQRDETAPGSRFVPFAEVAGATRTRRKSWDLSLRNGGTVSVRAGLDSDELPGGWAALDDAVAYLSRTR
ncbi:M48 family metallopeptidase [Actinoplanes sp. ATCC 53533]|uniref:M48 family metallopeptidase n=1 Tax=Actinoplanes sp. ATCC 53533 TaxID=1288362 RepID=UPI001F2F7588|nr:M48 family metallopeptidase [Actinoplanes sp. ATCC 53533]